MDTATTINVVIGLLTQNQATLALFLIGGLFTANGVLSWVVGPLKSALGTPSPDDGPVKVWLFKLAKVLDFLARNSQRLKDAIEKAELQKKLREHEYTSAAYREVNAALRTTNESHQAAIAERDAVIAEKDAVIDRQASNLEQVQKLVPKALRSSAVPKLVPTARQPLARPEHVNELSDRPTLVSEPDNDNGKGGAA